MAAVKKHIRLEQGANWTSTSWEASQTVTNFTAAMEVRSAPGNPPYLSLSAPDSITLSGTDIVITLDADDTENILIENSLYDLFVTDTAGTTTTKEYFGNIKCKKRITGSGVAS